MRRRLLILRSGSIFKRFRIRRRSVDFSSLRDVCTASLAASALVSFWQQSALVSAYIKFIVIIFIIAHLRVYNRNFSRSLSNRTADVLRENRWRCDFPFFYLFFFLTVCDTYFCVFPRRRWIISTIFATNSDIYHGLV